MTFPFFSLKLPDAVIQITQEKEKLAKKEFPKPLQNPLKNLNSCSGKIYPGVPTSTCTLDIWYHNEHSIAKTKIIICDTTENKSKITKIQ